MIFSQAEDGIRYRRQSRGLGNVYKRQLLYGADDVMKMLPSAQEKDYQETMKERYGYEVEYGTGGKRDGTD